MIDVRRAFLRLPHSTAQKDIILLIMPVEIQFLFFAHGLMMLYTCTKFCENTFHCFKMEQLAQHSVKTSFLYVV